MYQEQECSSWPSIILEIHHRSATGWRYVNEHDWCQQIISKEGLESMCYQFVLKSGDGSWYFKFRSNEGLSSHTSFRWRSACHMQNDTSYRNPSTLGACAVYCVLVWGSQIMLSVSSIALAQSLAEAKRSYLSYTLIILVQVRQQNLSSGIPRLLLWMCLNEYVRASLSTSMVVLHRLSEWA